MKNHCTTHQLQCDKANTRGMTEKVKARNSSTYALFRKKSKNKVAGAKWTTPTLLKSMLITE